MLFAGIGTHAGLISPFSWNQCTSNDYDNGLENSFGKMVRINKPAIVATMMVLLVRATKIDVYNRNRSIGRC